MERQLKARLVAMARAIKALKRIRLCESGWRDEVPTSGGIYVIWARAEKNAIYVGESCNLHSRFGDLGRIANHTFRRKAAKIHGTYEKQKLNTYLSGNYTLSFKAISFGRKEIEEYLILKWNPKHNRRQKRLLESDQYRDL